MGQHQALVGGKEQSAPLTTHAARRKKEEVTLKVLGGMSAALTEHPAQALASLGKSNQLLAALCRIDMDDMGIVEYLRLAALAHHQRIKEGMMIEAITLQDIVSIIAVDKI